MKISTYNIPFDTIKYKSSGNLRIPVDAKILSVGFDGFDIQIIYQHCNNIIDYNSNIKNLYWYKVETYCLNSNIYSLDNMELKYGTYFNRVEGRNIFYDGHFLYQVEKTIDEIRDDKLNYLLG